MGLPEPDTEALHWGFPMHVCVSLSCLEHFDLSTEEISFPFLVETLFPLWDLLLLN